MVKDSSLHLTEFLLVPYLLLIFALIRENDNLYCAFTKAISNLCHTRIGLGSSVRVSASTISILIENKEYSQPIFVLCIIRTWLML